MNDAITQRFAPLHPRLVDLSLGRVQRLLADLGHPETRTPPIIHVAGTNGKGSTVAFMRSILEAAGKRVHVYTSPHLVRFNERIRLAGRLVDDEALDSALDECERVNAGQSISVFEITTAAAFLLFAKVPADYLLLEVGLGGRFDATNVIANPAATVITPVSIDHQEFLGATVDKIAFEKAGIIKSRRPVVIAAQAEEALRVIEREADLPAGAATARGARLPHPQRERPAGVRGRARIGRSAQAPPARPSPVRQRRRRRCRFTPCCARPPASGLRARGAGGAMAGAAAKAARRGSDRPRARRRRGLARWRA